MPMRVWFVCYGNICRSPMAEVIFRDAVRARPALEHVVVASAGVGAIEGHEATPEAVEVMRLDFGLDLTTHRARRVHSNLPADLVFGMDAFTTRRLRLVVPFVPVWMIGEYAETGEEVADPYGEDLPVYRVCAEQIARLVDAAIERIDGERGQ